MAKVKGDLETDVLKLRNYTASPTAVEGGFHYNTTDGKFYGSTDGSTWAEIGSGAGARFEQTFTASTTWTMTHNLGVQPSISIIDSNNDVIEADNIEITTTQVIATFTSAVAGKIIATGGSITSSTITTYEALDANGDVGDGVGQVADGLHSHPSTDFVSNMKLDYTSGRLKIVGVDGNDLSSSNPAYVNIPYGTTFKKLTFTTSPFFDDDTAAPSDIAGSYFHTFTARAWGDDCPFFVYAVYDTSDNPFIFISPAPNLKSISSNANRISYHGTVGSIQDKYTVFILSDTVTVGNLTSQPCVRIGSIAMTKAVTTNDWTVTGHSVDGYGIGAFPHNRIFTLPAGQGSAGLSNIYTRGNGPSWSDTIAKYKITEDGICLYMFRGRGACTNGSDTVASGVATPYSNETPVTAAHGTFVYGGSGRIGYVYHDASSQFMFLVYYTAFTSSTNPINNGWGSSDSIQFSVTYNAF